MSDPSAARPVRKVAVADHIWNAYELMAQEMGSERDALINQAMFMFARLNGFLEAGVRSAASADISAPAPATVRGSNFSSGSFMCPFYRDCLPMSRR